MMNNGYLFFKTTEKSREEAKQLTIQLTAMLEEHEFPFELKNHILFALKNAGASGLKKVRAKVNRFLKSPDSTVEDCFLVIGGNTYDYRAKLKEMGFRAECYAGTWINYKQVKEDKCEVWRKEIESTTTGLYTFKTYNPASIIEVLNEAISLDKEEAEHAKKPEVQEDLEGEKVNIVAELKPWYARIIKAELENDIIFRNIKITRIYRETDKAMYVDAVFYGGLSSCCGVCGRGLDNDISRACGIGPICAGRMGLARPTRKNAKEILKKLEVLANEMKPISKKWIPKKPTINNRRNRKRGSSMKTVDDSQITFLAQSLGVWGKGNRLDDALENLKSCGGNLKACKVTFFPANAKPYVNGEGRTSWVTPNNCQRIDCNIEVYSKGKL